MSKNIAHNAKIPMIISVMPVAKPSPDFVFELAIVPVFLSVYDYHDTECDKNHRPQFPDPVNV